MVDIQFATAENRRGKKKEEERRNHDKNIMACPIHKAAINRSTSYNAVGLGLVADALKFNA